MPDTEKRCSTCASSYYPTDGKREHCSNPNYLSPNYTHDMRMEDWSLGYCRFWAPKRQKGVQHEQ